MFASVRRYIVIAGLVTLTLFCAGCAGLTATRSAAETRLAKATAPATPRRAASRKKAAARPTPAAGPLTASAQQALTAAVAPLARSDDGQVAVAVDDLTTGAEAAYAGPQEFVTASIVKVDILSTLLYQAQQSGQPLSSEDPGAGDHDDREQRQRRGLRPCTTRPAARRPSTRRTMFSGSPRPRSAPTGSGA
jgi:hypothetical protein